MFRSIISALVSTPRPQETKAYPPVASLESGQRFRFVNDPGTVWVKESVVIAHPVGDPSRAFLVDADRPVQPLD